MMVLIDRKFNEEQLLLETFSPKSAYWVRYSQKTNNFFPLRIYFHVIDNSLLAHSRCCQISYFVACIIGGYATTYQMRSVANGSVRNSSHT